MLDTLDRQLFLLLNAHADAPRWWIGLWTFLAVQAHWLLLVLLAVYVLRRGKASLTPLLAAVIALALGAVACELIGHFWNRPRPFVLGLGFLHLHHGPSASFPSSHATAYGAIAFSFLLMAGHRAFGCILLVLAVLVAVARVVVGVHYPMDVLFGLILGGLAASVAHYVFARAGRRHATRGMIVPPQTSGKEEQ
ncbi:phosphatase PAP2 family protein [Variovorax sp. Sphag1AA]|uniref:phosphatase PAP2 family protein n=1 Tax=Variovorax sp. Sphag1AA TaxID=2587027 RepID=UPI00160775E8|nr:phosphatase PAP2 family protein [Variovorax sp. Sphag1AA]MBB3175962.1 undecaprenyl-diphosphatase [Variovorax sp. Sphag1AA]